MDQLKLNTNRSLAKESFYREKPSFESLIADNGQTTLDFAALVDVKSSHVIDVIQVFRGSVSSDFRRFVTASDPGRFLIGRVFPTGGWKGNGDLSSGRHEFCFEVNPDGHISYGFEGERKVSVEALREFMVGKYQ